MKELLLKYALLNSFEKKEVQIFVDFLLAKKKENRKKQTIRKILPQVSVWQEDDITFYSEIRQNDRTLLSW